jgi:hypothetical protein
MMALLPSALRWGTHAARPAASSNLEGVYYFETDTTNLFQVQSAAWVKVAISAASGFANPMTTAGDIIIGGAAGDAIRLAKGADGTVLTIDNSTHLPVWTAPGGGGASTDGCGLYKSGNQTINSGVTTAVTFDTESWDTGSYHDTSTNNTRITVPSGKGGKFLITADIRHDGSGGANTDLTVYTRLNGTTTLAASSLMPAGVTVQGNSLAQLVTLADADYVEVIVQNNSGGNIHVQAGNANGPLFAIQRIGS